MNIEKLSNTYCIRKLTEHDVDSVLELCVQNHTFYRYHPPLPSKKSIIEDMEALPSGKTHSDKFYIGFFRENYLIAVMDLILSYPNNATAFIGFFMVDASSQGAGIGSGIISDVLGHLKCIGYQNVQLGIDRGNPQSESFWTKNDFVRNGKVYNGEGVSYLYMERKLY